MHLFRLLLLVCCSRSVQQVLLPVDITTAVSAVCSARIDMYNRNWMIHLLPPSPPHFLPHIDARVCVCELSFLFFQFPESIHQSELCDADKQQRGRGGRRRIRRYSRRQFPKSSGRLRRTSSTGHCFISIDTELYMTEKCGKMARRGGGRAENG